MHIFELSEFGKKYYPQRDQDLERAVIYLINRIGAEVWRARKAAIVERLFTKLESPVSTPIEGTSIRDREDEFGWYLHLGEQMIADPPAVDSDQAARIAPYLSALGRKLDALLTIQGINERIDKLVYQQTQRDPDQALFELIIGASYAAEGWRVIALPENSREKTPDFQIDHLGERYLVECKRLTRRSDYTERERSAWLRLWNPASKWLLENDISLIWTVLLHEEANSYPANFMLDLVGNFHPTGAARVVVRDDERCLVMAEAVDYASISKVLKSSYVKTSSSREREVITGRHQPDSGLTSLIKGKFVTMGPASAGRNTYWDEIHYVSAAYWRCDATAAVNSKARDVKKRLAEATEQLSDTAQGVVHIGIESGEGDDVELVRSQKVLNMVRTFDPRGKKLTWVYLHFFRGESPPDELWAIDETCQWFEFGSSGMSKPLKSGFLLGDESVPSFQRAHWEPANK